MTLMHTVQDHATRQRAARHLPGRTARHATLLNPGRKSRQGATTRIGPPAGREPVPCPLSGAELRQLVIDTLG